MPEYPAYASSAGAPIDQTPGDYQLIGDAFALGATGQAADAGTQWQHGANLGPGGHTRRDWVEADLGFNAWTGDYWNLSAGQAPNAGGTLQVVRLKNPTGSLSVTNIHLIVQTAGSVLTANDCFCGLYDANRNKLGTGNSAGGNGFTNDQSSLWTSTGLKTMAVNGGPFTITTTTFFIVFVATGTTLPKFLGGGLGATMINGLLAAASSRFATADTGITTTMPATLAALSQTNASAFWAATS